MPSINDVLLMWREQEKSLADLGMGHVDRGRLEQTFFLARQIAAELGADLAAVRPHQDPNHDKDAIEAAYAKQRTKVPPLRSIQAALQRDAAANDELPLSASKGVDAGKSLLAPARSSRK